jgi:hypothetical protein
LKDSGQPWEGQRGAALLLATILVAAAGLASLAVERSVLGYAREVGARRQVTCARFAALAALSAPRAAIAAGGDLGLAGVDRVDVEVLALDDRCRLAVRARCGSAGRRVVRDLDPAVCDDLS